MLTDSVRAQGWTNFTFERLLNTNDATQVRFDSLSSPYRFFVKYFVFLLGHRNYGRKYAAAICVPFER
jgi:hypothetical protein